MPTIDVHPRTLADGRGLASSLPSASAPEVQAVRAPGELCVLALAAAAGDDDAFEALHDRLGPKLVAVISRRAALAPAEAEELAQEAWVTVWKLLREGRFRPERAAFESFLVGVAWNLVLRRRRALGRELRALSELALEEGSVVADAPPDGGVLFSELLHGLRGCLEAERTPNALDDEERRVLDGASQGRTERDLAGELHLAPSTVNARKTKALRKLRRCLAQKGLMERGT